MRSARSSVSPVLVLWALGVTLFTLGPLILVMLVSLTPLDYISFPSQGFSLRWYRELLHRPELLTAASNSLWLAMGATVAALGLGIPASLALARHRFWGREAAVGVLMSPLFLPLILSALAILAVYSSWGWAHQPSRILVAHIALTLPYVIRTLMASLAAFDPRQELAARNLGATRWQAFVHVVLPQLKPGLLAAAVFAFIVSFDDVGLSLFLTGTNYMTLPVQLFSYASYNSDPAVAAISVVMVGVSFLAVVAVERCFGLEKLMR